MNDRKQLLKQRQTYDREVYQNYTLFEKGSWLEKPSPAIQRYIPVIQKKPESRVLDLGAGPGRHTIPVAQAVAPQGGLVTAVDYLPEALEKLNIYSEQYGVQEHIQPVLQQAEKMEIPPASYDWIFAVNLLEHLPSQEAAESLLARLESGVKAKQYITLVQECEVESAGEMPEPAWNPDAETAKHTLRRSFPSWRIVVEKEDTELSKKTITFLAQKE